MNTRSHYIFTSAQVIVVLLLLRFVFTLGTPWDFERVLGTALLLTGILGIAIACYQLGGAFAIRAEAHRLVTTGLYSRIRNPIYVFGTLLIAGFALIIHRPLFWLIVLAAIAA